MRTIPISILLMVVFFLLLLSAISFIAIKKIVNRSQSKRTRFSVATLYWIVSLGIVSYFIFLFIYPRTAATSTNYSAYFIFNILLITDLIIKSIISLSLVPYFILRLFRIKALSIIWGAIVLSVGIVLIIFYGSTFGRGQIQTRYAELKYSDLPESFNNLKIVHISDIHLGSFNGNQHLMKKALTKINTIQPDLILFTGDLVNNFSDELVGYSEVFGELTAKYGKFSILGNHDYGDYFNWSKNELKQQNFEAIQSAHADFGFTLLENRSIPIISGNDTIYIIGVENWGHPPFPQYADLSQALKDVPANKFKILLTHDPAHWSSKIAGKEDIQLTLSGHTHGMQLGIKIAGITFSPMYFIRKNWAGLYKHGDQFLYVNTGLGTIGISLRIEMPPEITVLTPTTN